METTTRFNLAINKLYHAFHADTLHPECSKQCAVGNILDHKDAWKHLTDNHGSTQLNYLGQVHQTLGRRFNGYTPLELLQIEATFLKACGYTIPLHHTNKKPINSSDKYILFKGLSAVVSYLCKLDDSPDIMDCSKLFKYEITKTEYLKA
ncbi:Na(+)-translocating NADH-quinone reductase subunit F [uncultured Formosa sp.]|uniref:Na(+)-translocating NADH-quinone reductase subunit F n=1 Tax=uncultured Formosa sp. TaxID=255435 RepID=UPI00260C5964|nr:Na(+)-translocating NADH-quinone reductase subunit F [uncultured Formosa sp.]